MLLENAHKHPNSPQQLPVYPSSFSMLSQLPAKTFSDTFLPFLAQQKRMKGPHLTETNLGCLNPCSEQGVPPPSIHKSSAPDALWPRTLSAKLPLFRSVQTIPHCSMSKQDFKPSPPFLQAGIALDQDKGVIPQVLSSGLCCTVAAQQQHPLS